MKRKLILILIAGFISAGFWSTFETASLSQAKPLTLGQVTTSLNVSRDKKKESVITAKKVRQVGVTFPLTPIIENELRSSGATDELIEAIRQNSPQLPKPTPTVDANAGERGAWELIKESTKRRDFELYLKTFPNGIYAVQAKAKYEQVWWAAIKDSTNKVDFEEFLRQFPAGQYAVTAQFALKRMERPDTKYQKALFSNKTWLTQNLNETIQNSICYNNNENNCASLGRLYTFDAAKRACASLGNGWRLPNSTDWKELTRSYGGAYGDDNYNGQDAYRMLVSGGNTGFNGSFGGKRIFISGGYYFYDFKNIGYYWVDETDPGNPNSARMFTFRSGDSLLLYEGIPKTDYVSCRCVKD